MPTLVEELLAEQRLLTPVAEFARRHQELTHRPDLAPHYERLIPLSAPARGEQYAFEVDLDLCTGCKACVTACHNLNGLSPGETWREVGVILADEPAVSRFVTSACHHCADPGCANGCPVLAYDKDPHTGIVRHLDDQCIGCQYCILKCPYDVPKYHEVLGIVRKCDLCHSRLSVGEAPACVQACPNEAIGIVNVTLGDVMRESLPVSVPARTLTGATTRYLGAEALPASARAADAATLRPEPAHWPLVLMLVLTQLALGVLSWRPSAGAIGFALGALLAGLVASVLHLGQPLRAWRVFLGLRRSWLSREVIAFGAFAGATSLWVTSAFGLSLPAFVVAVLPAVALASGALGLACSIMVYADVPRPSWRFPRTAPRFLGTVLSLGSAAVWAIDGAPAARVALIATSLALLAAEGFWLRDAERAADPLLRKSARLLVGPLRDPLGVRLLLAGVGGVLLPLLEDRVGWIAFALVLGAEILGRALFFVSAVAPRMPGNAAPARRRRHS